MSRKSCSDGAAGFTLIEALVALAIIAAVLWLDRRGDRDHREGDARDRPAPGLERQPPRPCSRRCRRATLLKPGRQSGELAGHRWRIDVAPLNVAVASDAPQTGALRAARRSIMRLQAPGGPAMQITTVRLVPKVAE